MTPHTEMLVITEEIPAGSFLDIQLLDAEHAIWKIRVDKSVVGYVRYKNCDTTWYRLSPTMTMHTAGEDSAHMAICILIETAGSDARQEASHAFADSLRWTLLQEDRMHNATEAERWRDRALACGSALEDMDIIVASLAAATSPANCGPCAPEVECDACNTYTTTDPSGLCEKCLSELVNN